MPSFYLYVQPSIKTAKKILRGKTLGITRYGASTDFTLRYLLKKWGMEPDRDVKVMQMGGQPEIVAAWCRPAQFMEAFCLHPPTSRPRRPAYIMLADFSQGRSRLPNHQSGFHSFLRLKRIRETVRRFLMAYSEGIDRLFRDKELTMKVIGKYTKHRRSRSAGIVLRIRHDFHRTPAAVTLQGYRNHPRASLARNDPKAKGHKADDLSIRVSTTSWKRAAFSSPWAARANSIEILSRRSEKQMEFCLQATIDWQQWRRARHSESVNRFESLQLESDTY